MGRGRDRIAAGALRILSRRRPEPPEAGLEAAFERGFAETDRFLARIPGSPDLTGRRVLDYGCGLGASCVRAAQLGAAEVLGVDVQPLDWARERVARGFPDLAGRIGFREIAGDGEIGPGSFDAILSKNTFEHVADPEAYVATAAAHLAPGGLLAIGFAPLWKAPNGGHLEFMTPLPWAHLIFPERIVLAERRRFRPDESPTRYEEVLGGLNRMTLERFGAVMESSGLEPLGCVVNSGDGASAPRRAVLRSMSALGRLAPLREYMSMSVHGLWRKPG